MNERAYQVADQVQANLVEINRRYEVRMKRLRQVIIISLIVAFLSTIAWLTVIWGLI